MSKNHGCAFVLYPKHCQEHPQVKAMVYQDHELLVYKLIRKNVQTNKICNIHLLLQVAQNIT